jgi:hypothetical protein
MAEVPHNGPSIFLYFLTIIMIFFPGLIYDIFGEYSIAFFVSGGLSTLGVCVLFLVPLLLSKHQQIIQNSKTEASGHKNTKSTSQPFNDLAKKDVIVFKTPHEPVNVKLLSNYEKNTLTSSLNTKLPAMEPCSDFVSLSGCPRHCIWDPTQPS